MTHSQWQQTSESWRLAHAAWQEWAERLLTEIGLQPEHGTWGDGPAREIIAERLRKRWQPANTAPTVVSVSSSIEPVQVAFLDRARKDARTIGLGIRYHDGSWVVSDGFGIEHYPKDSDVLGWMPLPEGPGSKVAP